MAISQYVRGTTPDGVVLGTSSTDKIGFYGLATPVVRRSGTAQVALTNTTAVAATGFGFSTSAAMISAMAQLEEIRATLVAYGLWAGS
jgi:hypothetical protein